MLPYFSKIKARRNEENISEYKKKDKLAAICKNAIRSTALAEAEVSNWLFLKILHLATSTVIKETNQSIRISSVFGFGRLLLPIFSL
jgi:hypothetical protein